MILFARLVSADVFIIFLLMIGIVIIPVVIAVWIFFIINRNSKNLRVWNATGKKLNLLQPNVGKVELRGVYNNCEVRIAGGVRHRDDSTQLFTYCIVNFEENLRFLLDINSPKGILTKYLMVNEMRLGVSYFDEVFNSSCYDPEILRRLLLSDFPSANTRNLMEDLMVASQHFRLIKITDEQVYLEIAGHVGTEEFLKLMLDVSTNLRNRFASARQSFPLAEWEKKMHHSWQAFAGSNRLSIEGKLPKMNGVINGFGFNAEILSKNGKWQTSLKLTFPKSLMLGLKIIPESSIHSALTWLGVQDVQTGIEDFDRSFLVKAENVGFTKALLTQPLCEQIMKLKSMSQNQEITDTEILLTIDTILGEKNHLDQYVGELLKTANMLINR